ncbi:MAG: hypothetical protein ACTHJT_07185 [Cytophaga sp.]|uniref:hypothetical protein n=1 Tax=Cytophaga sp. TaxID=29535 RepID=UPI003F7F6BE9
MKDQNPSPHHGGQKLTIVVEAPSLAAIPADALKALHTFERHIAATPGLKLSIHRGGTNYTEKTKNKPSESVSPEHWDYWPV